MAEDPNEDCLYLALTRPAMRAGCPVVGLMLNLSGSVLFAAWAGLLVRFSLFYGLALFVVVHFVMRILVERDHNIFRIKLLWMETKGRSLAAFELWGGSTLTPLTSRWPRKAADLPISIGWDDGV
jgi:type IV secretion system protein VirB3